MENDPIVVMLRFSFFLSFPHLLPPPAAEALDKLVVRRPYSGAGLLVFARGCGPWSEFRLHTRQPCQAISV